jgi:hypothetical protein
VINESILGRIVGEYFEMPGLRLTVGQASRLWQMDPATCSSALEALVTRGALYRTRDGAYLSSHHALGRLPTA